MTDALRALVAKWRSYGSERHRDWETFDECADELEAALNAQPVVQFEGLDHAVQAMWGKDWEQFNDYGPSSLRAAYAAGARSVLPPVAECEHTHAFRRIKALMDREPRHDADMMDITEPPWSVPCIAVSDLAGIFTDMEIAIGATLPVAEADGAPCVRCHHSIRSHGITGCVECRGECKAFSVGPGPSFGDPHE